MPASMIAATQIKMGMGCHSCDTKMYHCVQKEEVKKGTSHG